MLPDISTGHGRDLNKAYVHPIRLKLQAWIFEATHPEGVYVGVACHDRAEPDVPRPEKMMALHWLFAEKQQYTLFDQLMKRVGPQAFQLRVLAGPVTSHGRIDEELTAQLQRLRATGSLVLNDPIVPIIAKRSKGRPKAM